MNIPHKVRTLTNGPRHHFFGYYSVPLWNPAETQLLCIESEFQDHLPQPGERGVIGLRCGDGRLHASHHDRCLEPAAGHLALLEPSGAWP